MNFNKKVSLDTHSFEDVLKHKKENNETYERVLNILFQYNGETWDAYEVLGLPAGSSADAARSAFSDCLRKQPESQAFLKAALDAVIQAKSERVRK